MAAHVTTHPSTVQRKLVDREYTYRALNLFCSCSRRYEGLNLANSPQSNPPGEPVRYTINVATGAVNMTRLVHGYDFEFPVIPPHLVTQPAKFTYMAGNTLSARGSAVT